MAWLAGSLRSAGFALLRHTFTLSRRCRAGRPSRKRAGKSMFYNLAPGLQYIEHHTPQRLWCGYKQQEKEK
jgi:hypothetical protein